MQVVVVYPDPSNERVASLVRLSNQLGHPASIAPNWSDLLRGQGYSRGLKLVIVPSVGESTSAAEEAIAYLSSDQTGFVVFVADTIAPDVYKTFVKTERGEWITWKALPQELPELIRKLSSSAEEGRNARVVSFLPSAGGVGNTTLAMEAGFGLASGKKSDRRQVAVVDLNFQASSLADLLDLQPRLDVSELINRPDRLDDRLIEVFTSSYSPQLDVFSSPTRFNNREIISPDIVFSLLDGLSKRYDYVLADLPHYWSPWIDNVLVGSDAIVLTGGGTVPAVKQLATRVEYATFLGIPPERTRVVINQCDVGLLGTIPRKANIESALTGIQPIYVPRDSATASEAANTGKPMMELASRRPICKSVVQLAEWIRTVVDGSANLSK